MAAARQRHKVAYQNWAKKPPAGLFQANRRPLVQLNCKERLNISFFFCLDGEHERQRERHRERERGRIFEFEFIATELQAVIDSFTNKNANYIRITL